ncbi:MAG TPA: hypothetical protein VFQ35_09075, partial [Polyangiaceae bacterium]|nr:hypothetical protein [Polyangiaceae bacterium]
MFLDTGARGILALAFFAALSCLVGSACTTALWLERSEQPGVVLSREVPIVVHVSDRVIELDDEGNVDALVDALEEGLIEKGFEFRIIGLKAEVDGGSARVPVYPGRLPLPRVELAVSAHDESVD